MVDHIRDHAHAMVVAHGPEAATVARRAARNVQSAGMMGKAGEWEKVIDAIEALQALMRR
jgi:hypothetical protein